MRVLIVDDNDDIRQMLRLQIGLLPDIDLTEATDGSEAISVALDVRPDLVVLDLEMPVMTGAEALPVLKANHPEMQIIVHTSTPRELTTDDVLASADAFIQKGGDLLACLRSFGGHPVG